MTDSIFPNEEDKRGKLANGKTFMPAPHFDQMDNGVHTGSDSSPLGLDFDPTRCRVKSGNVETDLNGGLF
jgi:hypothetical protein